MSELTSSSTRSTPVMAAVVLPARSNRTSDGRSTPTTPPSATAFALNSPKTKGKWGVSASTTGGEMEREVIPPATSASGPLSSSSAGPHDNNHVTTALLPRDPTGSVRSAGSDGHANGDSDNVKEKAKESLNNAEKQCTLPPPPQKQQKQQQHSTDLDSKPAEQERQPLSSSSGVEASAGRKNSLTAENASTTSTVKSSAHGDGERNEGDRERASIAAAAAAAAKAAEKRKKKKKNKKKKQQLMAAAAAAALAEENAVRSALNTSNSNHANVNQQQQQPLMGQAPYGVSGMPDPDGFYAAQAAEAAEYNAMLAHHHNQQQQQLQQQQQQQQQQQRYDNLCLRHGPRPAPRPQNSLPLPPQWFSPFPLQQQHQTGTHLPPPLSMNTHQHHQPHLHLLNHSPMPHYNQQPMPGYLPTHPCGPGEVSSGCGGPQPFQQLQQVSGGGGGQRANNNLGGRNGEEYTQAGTSAGSGGYPVPSDREGVAANAPQQPLPFSQESAAPPPMMSATATSATAGHGSGDGVHPTGPAGLATSPPQRQHLSGVPRSSSLISSSSGAMDRYLPIDNGRGSHLRANTASSAEMPILQSGVAPVFHRNHDNHRNSSSAAAAACDGASTGHHTNSNRTSSRQNGSPRSPHTNLCHYPDSDVGPKQRAARRHLGFTPEVSPALCRLVETEVLAYLIPTLPGLHRRRNQLRCLAEYITQAIRNAGQKHHIHYGDIRFYIFGSVNMRTVLPDGDNDITIEVDGLLPPNAPHTRPTQRQLDAEAAATGQKEERLQPTLGSKAEGGDTAAPPSRAAEKRLSSHGSDGGDSQRTSEAAGRLDGAAASNTAATGGGGYNPPLPVTTDSSFGNAIGTLQLATTAQGRPYLAPPAGISVTAGDLLSRVRDYLVASKSPIYVDALVMAEVRVLKLLMEGSSYDLTISQFGGVNCVRFLHEMDAAIGGEHLLKRTLLLLKSWCSYEAHVLGGQGGYIGSYAGTVMLISLLNTVEFLEDVDSETDGETGDATNSARNEDEASRPPSAVPAHVTPLVLLARFLKFFSYFDYDHYCVTAFGPLPLRDISATPYDLSLLEVPAAHTEASGADEEEGATAPKPHRDPAAACAASSASSSSSSSVSGMVNGSCCHHAQHASGATSSRASTTTTNGGRPIDHNFLGLTDEGEAAIGHLIRRRRKPLLTVSGVKQLLHEMNTSREEEREAWYERRVAGGSGSGTGTVTDGADTKPRSKVCLNRRGSSLTDTGLICPSCTTALFPVRSMNVLDPLRWSSNMVRGVCRNHLQRITRAFRQGLQLLHSASADLEPAHGGSPASSAHATATAEEAAAVLSGRTSSSSGRGGSGDLTAAHTATADPYFGPAGSAGRSPDAGDMLVPGYPAPQSLCTQRETAVLQGLFGNTIATIQKNATINCPWGDNTNNPIAAAAAVPGMPRCPTCRTPSLLCAPDIGRMCQPQFVFAASHEDGGSASEEEMLARRLLGPLGEAVVPPEPSQPQPQTQPQGHLAGEHAAAQPMTAPLPQHTGTPYAPGGPAMLSPMQGDAAFVYAGYGGGPMGLAPNGRPMMGGAMYTQTGLGAGAVTPPPLGGIGDVPLPPQGAMRRPMTGNGGNGGPGRGGGNGRPASGSDGLSGQCSPTPAGAGPYGGPKGSGGLFTSPPFPQLYNPYGQPQQQPLYYAPFPRNVSAQQAMAPMAACAYGQPAAHAAVAGYYGYPPPLSQGH